MMNRFLSGLAVVALSTCAGADVVRSTNFDSSYNWGNYNTNTQTWFGRPFLDVTLSNTQPGQIPGPRTITRYYHAALTSTDYTAYWYAGAPTPGQNLRIATGPQVSVEHWSQGSLVHLLFTPVQVFHEGDTIGPALQYDGFGYTNGVVRTQGGQLASFDLVHSADFFVATRFLLNNEYHYGWVHFQGTPDHPIEWAYETQAETPIVITWGWCPGDWNRDGAVTSQDFFQFVASFFASDLAADLDHNGAVDSSDFFQYLSYFFAAC